jgi:2'-5' RNA ligase
MTMQTIRAFIAISLPETIQHKLSFTQDLLRENTGDQVVRWVKPSNIHLTLKFMGNIPETDVAILKQKLSGDVSLHPQFPLSIQGVGAFPSFRMPRVIWAGLQEVDGILRLQQSIESRMRELGYDSEERPFSAHVTIGRVSQHATRQQIENCGLAVSKCTVGSLGSFIVESVDIYRSELKPDGPSYIRLHKFYLKP